MRHIFVLRFLLRAFIRTANTYMLSTFIYLRSGCHRGGGGRDHWVFPFVSGKALRGPPGLLRLSPLLPSKSRRRARHQGREATQDQRRIFRCQNAYRLPRKTPPNARLLSLPPCPFRSSRTYEPADATPGARERPSDCEPAATRGAPLLPLRRPNLAGQKTVGELERCWRRPHHRLQHPQ